MKKIFIFFALSILFIQMSEAQMSYRPDELNINSPNEIAVYKKYMEGKTYLGLNAGLSIPFGDYGKNIGVGTGFGMQARYFISDNFAFGASFNYYHSNTIDSYLKKMDTLFDSFTVDPNDTNITNPLKVVSVDGYSTLYPFTVNLEYYFSPYKRFKPYVGLGLGFYVINTVLDVTTNKEKSQYFRDLESKYGGTTLTSSFGFTPYAGFMLDFNELMSMNFEMKYNQIFSTPIASSLTFNVGIQFNLGYKY
jgi:opacity protein-like surface antigen